MRIKRLKWFVPMVVGALVAAGWVWSRASWPIVNAPPSGGRIIALGDSLTAGLGAASGDNYVSVLSRRIGRPILNAGAAGDTTADGLARLERDVLARDPQIVIVFLGGNDVLQRRPIDDTFRDLDRIVAAVQSRGAMVVLVDSRPPLVGYQYGRRFRRLARERGCVLVAYILRDIFTDPSLKADPLHFNARGYAIVADRIDAALRRYEIAGSPKNGSSQ
jgi:lysophospholipase L1-like esterase